MTYKANREEKGSNLDFIHQLVKFLDVTLYKRSASNPLYKLTVTPILNFKKLEN